MRTWTRKIIFSFSGNPRFYPMWQKFSLGTTKFFNWNLWGFQKCR